MTLCIFHIMILAPNNDVLIGFFLRALCICSPELLEKEFIYIWWTFTCSHFSHCRSRAQTILHNPLTTSDNWKFLALAFIDVGIHIMYKLPKVVYKSPLLSPFQLVTSPRENLQWMFPLGKLEYSIQHEHNAHSRDDANKCVMQKHWKTSFALTRC